MHETRKTDGDLDLIESVGEPSLQKITFTFDSGASDCADQPRELQPHEAGTEENEDAIFLSEINKQKANTVHNSETDMQTSSKATSPPTKNSETPGKTQKDMKVTSKRLHFSQNEIPSSPTEKKNAQQRKWPPCRKHYRYKRRKRIGQFLVVVGGCFLFFIMFGDKYHRYLGNKQLYKPDKTSWLPVLHMSLQSLGEEFFTKARSQVELRTKRDTNETKSVTVDKIPPKAQAVKKNSTEKKEPMVCTTAHSFPDDPFLIGDTNKNFLIVLHLLISIYMFCAIAAVCDVYFVPSLEHICEDLGLQADVAGATFMAGASSAPELCTSLIGVFLAESDVGLGAIVGSSLFNLLAIVACCGIFSGMPVALSWYPLSRDTLFYSISVALMITFMSDNRIKWFEAVAMVFTYALYILWMVFNPQIEAWAKRQVEGLSSRRTSQVSANLGPSQSNLDEREQAIRFAMLEKRRYSRIAMTGGEQNPLRTAARQSIGNTSDDIPLKLTMSGIREINKLGLDPVDVSEQLEDSKDRRDISIEEYEDPLEWPDSCLGRVYYIIVFPITVLHVYTIPDSRLVGQWQGNLYLVSFFISVIYIALYSYLMVWFTGLAGSYVGIPETVTGLTILAAGTSVPDMLSSVFVARDGYGDMAVSNAIGSNVFDILLGLGLPWLIDSFIGDFHGTTIDSGGMMYASLTLAITIVYLWVSLKICHWTLTVTYGIVTLILYLIIITLCIMIEMNVFFKLNSDDC